MKILAVHSFAVHGTASLKAMMSLLGTKVLPVPSLFLSGLTNIPGHYKSQVEMRAILESSLQIAAERKEELLLFIGYLSSAQQVAEIFPLLEEYRPHLRALIVDPVSGDHGRTYVPHEVVQAWPALLEQADWALPNFTELQLHSGLALTPEIPPTAYLQAFLDRFPQLSVVVTSFPAEDGLSLHLHHQGKSRQLTHEQLQPHFGGTGDVFASIYLHELFFREQTAFMAMDAAARQTVQIIRTSIEAGSQDLILPGSL